MRILYILCLLFLLSAIYVGGRARAAEADNRRILALYDSSEDKLQLCNIHKRVEMPLNRLGFTVEYHDVNTLPLPDTTRYRAIVLWFSDETMKYADKYLVWLINHLKNGGKVVLFNGLGASEFPDETPVANSLLQSAYQALGLHYSPGLVLSDPFQVQLKTYTKQFFNFETKAQPEQPVYRDIKATAKDWNVWMSVSRKDINDSEAVAIATGPKGGIITDAAFAVRFFENPIWQIKWNLDPFAFLQTALNCKGNLRPDTTTAFGNRVGFSHIDGDGEHNYVQDIPGGRRLATEILFKDILQKYPVPVTVGFIAGVMTPQSGLDMQFLPLYRQVMALPNVQSGVHGYSHPMDWFNEVSGITLKGYTYNVEQETVGALELVSKLLCPPDKPANILLWTGDCQPKEDALIALAKHGYFNINGGDPRYDQLYDGICNICPLSVKLGSHRQIYAAACNEYLYTDHWTENFGGYANVIQTFIHSEKPRYLPVNVYFHIYVCERQAGLLSLQQVFEWTLSKPLCWLTAVEYVKSVRAFMRCSTGRNKAGDEYWISDYQNLNTVRLDNEKRVVDMQASSNVLGYCHFDNSLYISLVPTQDAQQKAMIKLADKPTPGLYIQHSAGKLSEVRLTPTSFEGKVRLYAPGKIIVKNGENNENIRYSINGNGDQQAKDGVIPLPAGKGEEVALRIWSKVR